MTATVLKWIILALAVLNAGYMTFDGGRALLKGDYIRPTSGEHAGELGPWTRIVSIVGIQPESTLMKSIFVVWGIVGLLAAFSFFAGLDRGLPALIVFNVLSLWYLVPGTISSSIQIVLLGIVWFVSRSDDG